MRTLIVCLFLAAFSTLKAQEFFVDILNSDPVIVQNHDSTFSELVNGELILIHQPKDERFTWIEMLELKNSGIVSRYKNLRSETHFTPTELPFFVEYKFFDNYRYILKDSNVVLKSKITGFKRESEVGPLILTLLVLVLSFVIAVVFVFDHKSTLSLAFVGLALVATMVASHNFGWHGYGIGLTILLAFVIHDYKRFWDGASSILIAGIFCLPYAFEWSDAPSKQNFTITMAVFVTLIWLAKIILMISQESRDKAQPKGVGIGHV